MKDYERINAASWDDTVLDNNTDLADANFTSKASGWTTVALPSNRRKAGQDSRIQHKHQLSTTNRFDILLSDTTVDRQSQHIQAQKRTGVAHKPCTQIRTAPLPLSSVQQPKKALPSIPRSQRTWQGSSSSGSSIQRVTQLFGRPDKSAENQWRMQRPPTASIRIPSVLAVQDMTYKSIGNSHECFIHSYEVKGASSSSESITFGIWGDMAAVQKTKDGINAWIEREMRAVKSKASSEFSKVISYTAKRRELAEKRWRREVKREKFRQHPQYNTIHESIGTFRWPESELRADEVFGSHLEALDPIRMSHSCYIVWKSDVSVFQVMGKPKHVPSALVEIRRAFYQVMARQITPVHLHTIRWSANEVILTHVNRAIYKGPQIISPAAQAQPAVKMFPIAQGDMVSADARLYAERKADMLLVRLRATLAESLRKLHYYHGVLCLRVRLGKFLLDRSLDPSEGNRYELEEYERMTAANGFKARVSHEIGNEAYEQNVLAHLVQAKHFLQPGDAFTETLDKVKPVFSAHFTFDDPGGDLCLSITWTEHSETGVSSCFTAAAPKWTRLENQRSSGPRKLVDMTSTNLNTGTCWAIELLASRPVDTTRLSGIMTNFPSKVTLDTQRAVSNMPNVAFVRYPPHPKLRSVRQMASYQYRMNDTDFSLELTRFSITEHDNQAETLRIGNPKVYGDRWALSVFRTSWDTWFAKNENLKIGHKTDWSDNFADWFPREIGPGVEATGEEDGFMQLMQRLSEIEAIVGKGDIGQSPKTSKRK